MGYEHINAAEIFNGKPFSVKSKAIFSGSITTVNYSGEVTDSAASATAMATGEKVSYGVLSRRIPGDSSELETVFETAKSKYYKTGLITTSYIIDATPAAFVSHSDSRSDYGQISRCIFSFRPEIMIGGLKYLYFSDFSLNEFTPFNSLEDYENSRTTHFFVKLGDTTAPYEYDFFSSSGNLPHYLSRSAAIAMTCFNAADKFILLIEGGRIDHAGHSGSIENSIYETNEFFSTAESIYNWLNKKEDYLMIITADHETGGLNIITDNGAGCFPTVGWTSDYVNGIYSHTDREVPVYIYSDILSESDLHFVEDNTDISRVINSFIVK